ncbi:hypothetical protein E8E14_006879 [Neopestalotiopsis sp. 37M]|nr:hypothetical protein E8E14_006879 [Neopestalotiopsis sp. 37M]
MDHEQKNGIQQSFNGTDDILVIGIDFGTTNSGAAWSTLDDIKEGQIYPITQWPGTNREEAKAPTELFYEDSKTHWGFDVPVDADPVRWFKLLLLKDEDVEADVKSSEPLLRARKMLKENERSAIDLIADYLRQLWQHVIQSIEASRGEVIVGALRFHIVITVPAIWKIYARQGMQEAAKLAGLLDRRSAGPTTLSFVPEPEAAALATLSEPGRKFQQSDVFVVCDAGGGTVDLISYRVESTKPIKLAEAVEGTGGLCGGIFVDESFERICKSRLGRRWDRLSKAGINEVMKREWEYGIKPQFKLLGGTKKYTVSIPAEAFTGSSKDDDSREPIIRNGRIYFGEEHIKKAFLDVFPSIEDLINGQIKKSKDAALKVSGIILVGGLGCSPYLYEHLKSRYQHDGISVLQSSGHKPRSAICRGAVYKGFLDGVEMPERIARNLPVQVASTIARASYGMEYRVPFDQYKHAREDKEWDDDELNWKAKGQMEWFIRKGKNISKKEPVRRPYYQLHETDFGGLLTVALETCEDEEPPDRRTSSVNKLCAIESNLDVPFHSLPDWANPDGQTFKKLEFEVEMVPSGATLEFAVYIDGRKQRCDFDVQKAIAQYHKMNSYRSCPEQSAERLRCDAQASVTSVSVPISPTGTATSHPVVLPEDSRFSESSTAAQDNTASLFDDLASVDQFSVLTLDGDSETQIAEEINAAEAFFEDGASARAYLRFQVALALLSKSPTPMPSSFYCHAHLGMAECRISMSDDKTKESALEYLKAAHKHALKAMDLTDDASRPAARMALLVMTMKQSEMEAGIDGLSPTQASIFYADLNKEIDTLRELIETEHATPQRISYKGLLARGEEWRSRVFEIGQN